MLVTLFTGFGGAALAAGETTISLNPNSVTVSAGDGVNVIASVTNKTGDRLDCRVKVGSDYYGEGPLEAGETREVHVDITVSESMLDTELSFKVEYYSGDSWQQGDSANLAIHRKGQNPVIKCTATANHTQVDPGGEVTLSFDIQNQGDVTFENIEVKADNLNGGKAINQKFSLKPGKSWTVTYKYTFTKAITFKPYINYTVSGSNQTLKYNDIPPIELTETIRKVKVSLDADDKTPDPGQEVTFTLKITNDGTMPYSNLSVTWNGETMSFPTRQLKPADDYEKQYKMTFDASTDVSFTITMKDQLGQTVSVSTNTIRILLPVDPAALQSGLNLVIEPDRVKFTSAGVVNFSGYISNDSEYTLSEVSITESTLGSVFSVSELAADTKLPISFSADINETTTYTFVYSVKDRNGQVYTVSAEPITITIQTSEPKPTDISEGAATVTLPPANASSDPVGIWGIIAIVLIVLIIGVGIALVILWRNGRSPSRPSRSSSRPASRTAVPKGKKTVRGGYSKSIKSRSFRDRNNF